LWAFALLPVLILLYRRAELRRRRAIETLGSGLLISQLFPASIPQWRVRRAWIGIWVFVLLTLAAARPQYGRTQQTIERTGVDVIIAVDTSPSMLAEDIKPNRLTAAKDGLKRLVRRLEGNRVGIVAFAGEAFLVCPMTLDHSLASLVLEALDEDTVGASGTSLGTAISTAQKAFERGGSGSPVLVLLTDGEDNEGRGLAAAKEAAEAGIRIHAIGIGTDRGAPVPDGAAGYKETEDGKKVVSRLDIGGLRAIAEAGGGIAYAASDNPNPAVNSIMLQIDRMRKSELESRRFVIYQDRYGWFIVPAMVLLLLLLIVPPGRMTEAGSGPAMGEEAADGLA
jgi:Ca-activated chloride channel family protein